MSTSYTPGPWSYCSVNHLNTKNKYRFYVGPVERDDFMDELAIVFDKDISDRAEANARLFAAAPYLLERAKDMIDAIGKLQDLSVENTAILEKSARYLDMAIATADWTYLANSAA